MFSHTEAAPALQRQSGHNRSPGDQTQLQRHYSTSAHPTQARRPDGRPPLDHEIEAFLLDRESRQLSPGTLAFYREKLGVLTAFAQTHEMVSVCDLTAPLVRRYLRELRSTHTEGGVHAFYRALRALVNWWEEEHEPTGWRNPLAKVKAPKVPQEVLEPAPLADISAMVAVCPEGTELGRRDRAILLALLDTGCRAQEFLDLCNHDVDLATGVCQVRRGKGGKTRSVFLGETAPDALRGYLELRRAHDPLTPLWATRGGTRLSYSGLREIVRRRARRAEVPAPSLHSFRRAFALACLRSGCDLITLQRMLGHSSLAVVSRYLRQVDDDLLRAHRTHAPVDTLLASSTHRGGR